MLLVAPVYYGAKGQWYLRAFCSLGHKTMLVNQANYFGSGARSMGERILTRLRKRVSIVKYNHEICASALSFKPDLIVIMKGLNVYPETLIRIKKELQSVCFFNINYDDYFSRHKGNISRNLHESIPLYDCLFTTRRVNVNELLEFGASRAEYMPFCYDPSVLYPVIPSASEYRLYKSDVVFIGSFEQPRANMLERIADFDVAIWGNQWGKLKRTSPIRGAVRHKDVYEIEFSKVLNSSKIALNFFRRWNRDELNSRVFELPACGAFVISERTEEQAKFFEEDKEIVCFSDSDELRDKVSYYLKHDAERRKIARAGYERVKRERHTVQDRVVNVLNVFRELRS